MSYILEALKKSQRERELGRVPTLADARYLSTARPRRGAYWGIVALILALLAFLIALYGTFGKEWLAGQDPEPVQAEVTPQKPPEPKLPTSAPKPMVPTSTAIAADTIPQTSKPQHERSQPATTTKQPKRPEKRPKPASTAAVHAEPSTPPAPIRQKPSGLPEVPSDLVQDVRRFEKQLRQEQRAEPPEAQAKEPQPIDISRDEPLESDAEMREPAPATEPADAVPAAPAPQTAKKALPRPEELPSGLQQSVSELRLTVHVYSADPKQRFVIINSRKTREGERSRKGFLVEEITPDGVKLEYQGRRFFYPR